MKSQRKDAFLKLCDLLDTVESMLTLPAGTRITLRDVFRLDVNSFLLYLAASDGRLTGAERDYINDLLDQNLSTQAYAQMIREQNIYSTEFENTLPLTLKIVSKFDRHVRGRNTGAPEVVPMLVDFMEKVGSECIRCGGSVSQQAIRDFTLYISNLKASLLRLETKEEAVCYLGAKNRQSAPPSGSSVRKYGPSAYKVGLDIPAGPYKLLAPDQNAYYCISTDANGNHIIHNDGFTNQAYIVIYDGQYLELSRCHAVAEAQAPVFDGSSGIYGPGEYKVGPEIPAGEYRLTALASNGYCSAEIFTENGAREIISNKGFTNASYFQVKDGQILVLNNCKIVL